MTTPQDQSKQYQQALFGQLKDNTHTTGTQMQAGTQGNAQPGQTRVQGGQAQGQFKTVLGVFTSRDQAEAAVNAMRRQGFTTNEISIITKKGEHEETGSKAREHEDRYYGAVNSAETVHSAEAIYDAEEYSDDITDGTLAGGTLGGLGGLLLGAGALAIPGVGPILAAGPLAAALGGAVAGGLAGGLIDYGIPAESSRNYEQRVAKGDLLVVVRAEPNKIQQAAQIMRQNGAEDVESH